MSIKILDLSMEQKDKLYAKAAKEFIIEKFGLCV